MNENVVNVGVMPKNKLLQAVWRNRGYDDKFYDKLSACNHELPRKIDDLCASLKRHHDQNDLVVLYTDFDMDGIMSGVVGYAGMKELGFNVELYYPSTDAYGFSVDDVKDIIEKYPDVKAIVTADVGVTAFSAVAFGLNHGIDMLVTDHHHPKVEEQGLILPVSDVVVDPVVDVLIDGAVTSPYETDVNADDEESFEIGESARYFDGICGAHVLYLVLHFYAKTYCSQALSNIERLRVFAGFGTVSDSMPVWYENRPLIRDAVSTCRCFWPKMIMPEHFVFGAPKQYEPNFSVLEDIDGCETYRNAFRGLAILLTTFANDGKLPEFEDFNEIFLGYYLAPAFNSIKRMGQHIDAAYEVFFGNTEFEQMSAAKFLLELNARRKDLVQSAMDDFPIIAVDTDFRPVETDADQPYAPYIYFTDVTPGVCGLLAQRVLKQGLMQCGVDADGNPEYISVDLPAFVVQENEDGSFTGSGRCPSWFPFLTVISEMRKKYDFCANVAPAGHEVAFGILFSNALVCKLFFEHLSEEIKTRFDAFVASGGIFVKKPDFLISTFSRDADSNINDEVFRDYLEEVELYRPFGSGFEDISGTLEFRFSKFSPALVANKSGAKVESIWSILGKNKQHLKVNIAGGLTVVMFNVFPNHDEYTDVVEAYNDLVDWLFDHMCAVESTKQCVRDFDGNIVCQDVVSSGIIRLNGKLSMNRFNGNESVQFVADTDGFDSAVFMNGVQTDRTRFKQLVMERSSKDEIDLSKQKSAFARLLGDVNAFIVENPQSEHFLSPLKTAYLPLLHDKNVTLDSLCDACSVIEKALADAKKNYAKESVSDDSKVAGSNTNSVMEMLNSDSSDNVIDMG